ncbi:MAG: hypothetical protein ABSE73_23585 [Planctomycetota bacterium]
MGETNAKEAPTSPAPVYRVQRWQRRNWRNVTAPLPRRETEQVAAALKRRPKVPAFHVRIAQVTTGENADE